MSTDVSLHKRAILAASSWPSNAEMIVDVVELGFIRPTDTVIDLTWGSGIWWKKYRHPGPFIAVCNDERKDGTLKTPPLADNITVATADYTALDESVFPTGMADVTVFDPPYVSIGGRETSTIPKFLESYGLRDAASHPRALHAYNMFGLCEACRITKPGGIVLVKCMDYVSSGKTQQATRWMLDDAEEETPLRLVQRFIHVGGPGPQPKVNLDGTERRQVHARNNYSVLYIFKKPRRRSR